MVALCILGLLAGESRAAASRDNTLWYDEPADKWLEAQPLGNGRLGAVVFGGVQKEKIQLNEESLWSGQPLDCNPEGALKQERL